MPDYKEMYFKLFRAGEQAINTLIQVQQECEELYISQLDPGLKVLSILTENKKSTEEQFQIHALAQIPLLNGFAEICIKSRFFG
ncbi:MAG: hypothetical protein RSF33_08830 [Hydrogenoanaerobacterium sp.]